MFLWNDGDLNPEQEDAIKSEKSVFLIACPGSGKTRTLTYKIAYELSRLESKKRRVIAITYTHRAAEEIHERIDALGVDTTQLWIGTIHSFCLEWILKPYGVYHPELCHGFRVINSHDTEEIISGLCRPYRNPRVTYWDCGFYFENEEYALSSRNRQLHPTIRAVLADYFAILSRNRQIDFELMLCYAFQLIVRFPAISALLSKLFAFVLMDEYQDTKRIQYSIVASILRAGNKETKTFIVGDPNQSIFQSLGGFPIAAREFAEMAGVELEERKLWHNYRSSERIVSYFGNYNVYSTEIESASKERAYPSLVSYNHVIDREGLEDELAQLIRFNIERKGIAPHEICILAPWWVSLAGMTRRLVAGLPEYEFDGPGMVPFARDIDNFWYKLSRIILTNASPQMYVRRFRWAAEVLRDLEDAGLGQTGIKAKALLRKCNSIESGETDGLNYLAEAFDTLFAGLEIDFRSVPVLKEHHDAFFESSNRRIERLRRDGAEFIGEISNFRRVFENRRGITVSTIHGIKGDEYDTVIAYALLEGMLPHFNDADPAETAMKLLYVIGSRARKNLHLISERGRLNGRGEEYQATEKLSECVFDYDVLAAWE